jgi:putative transposase
MCGELDRCFIVVRTWRVERISSPSISPNGIATYWWNQVDLPRAVVQKVKLAHRFQIDAMVILPDHLHAVWTLPVGDCDFATRWMLIKVGFSQQIAKEEWRNENRLAKSERGIWQWRSWEHVMRAEVSWIKESRS